MKLLTVDPLFLACVVVYQSLKTTDSTTQDLVPVPEEAIVDDTVMWYDFLLVTKEVSTHPPNKA